MSEDKIEIRMSDAQRKAYDALVRRYVASGEGVPCDSVEGLVLEELEHLGVVVKNDHGGLFAPRWFPVMSDGRPVLGVTSDGRPVTMRVADVIRAVPACSHSDPPLGSLEEQATRIALSATGWTPDPDKPHPTVVEAVKDLAERFEKVCLELAEGPATKVVEAARVFVADAVGGYGGNVWRITGDGKRLIDAVNALGQHCEGMHCNHPHDGPCACECEGCVKAGAS